jgi:hypothetical protein
MASHWGNMVSAHTNQNGVCCTFLSDSLRAMVGFTLPKPCSIVGPFFLLSSPFPRFSEASFVYVCGLFHWLEDPIVARQVNLALAFDGQMRLDCFLKMV